MSDLFGHKDDELNKFSPLVLIGLVSSFIAALLAKNNLYWSWTVFFIFFTFLFVVSTVAVIKGRKNLMIPWPFIITAPIYIPIVSYFVLPFVLIAALIVWLFIFCSNSVKAIFLLCLFFAMLLNSVKNFFGFLFKPVFFVFCQIFLFVSWIIRPLIRFVSWIFKQLVDSNSSAGNSVSRLDDDDNIDILLEKKKNLALKKTDGKGWSADDEAELSRVSGKLEKLLLEEKRRLETLDSSNQDQQLPYSH